MIDLTKADMLGSADELIVKASKNYLKTAIFILAGAVSLALAVVFKNSQLLNMLFMIAGASLLVVGLILLFSSSDRWAYAPTKEIFHKEKYYFNRSDREKVMAALKNGEFGALRQYSNQDTVSQNIVMVYSTKSGSCRIVQTFHYVPYNYIPDADPIVYKKD